MCDAIPTSITCKSHVTPIFTAHPADHDSESYLQRSKGHRRRATGMRAADGGHAAGDLGLLFQPLLHALGDSANFLRCFVRAHL